MHLQHSLYDPLKQSLPITPTYEVNESLSGEDSDPNVTNDQAQLDVSLEDTNIAVGPATATPTGIDPDDHSLSMPTPDISTQSPSVLDTRDHSLSMPSQVDFSDLAAAEPQSPYFDN